MDHANSGLTTSCPYTDERRRFAQVSHEYLIEQVQHQTTASTSGELNFNHPVKEIVWTGAYDTATGSRTALSGGNYRITLNGHDRFAERPEILHSGSDIPHHTGCGVESDGAAGAGKAASDEIAVYSFALKPEEHQPSELQFLKN